MPARSAISSSRRQWIQAAAVLAGGLLAQVSLPAQAQGEAPGPAARCG